MAPTTSEDTEITLDTGKMLALFFGLVAICAVFFGMGFSLGRGSSKPSAGEIGAGTSLPNGGVRTVTAKPSSTPAPDVTSKPAGNNDSNGQQTSSNSTPGAASATAGDPTVGEPLRDPTAAPAPGVGYFVQVAAVSKQEDADSLVDALKRKQYPAFSAANAPDKLFHVQVGPYADVKDAEAMRGKLVSDGYNPILKK